MDKTKLLALGVLVLLTVAITINLSDASGGNPFNKIIRKLNRIIFLIEDEVIPQLDCESYLGVPKTGQKTSYAEGDDGYWQKGVAPQSPRFMDNEDGTVADTFTGLMWTMDAQQIPGEMDWFDAIDLCNNLIFAGYEDWRLPNVREMLSIIDYGFYDPALTPGHPFINVPGYPGRYWVSTTMANNPDEAMHVPIVNGAVNGMNKTSNLRFVWAVRGGN